MTTRTNLDGSRRALFSDCFTYRYELLIRWAPGPPLVMCCLNPSTADEMKNDPTVHRQCERAHQLNFGAFLMLNAFAIRSKDPDVMKAAADPYGEWRDPSELVASYFRHNGGIFIAGWGVHAKHRGRHDELLEAFTQAQIPVHYLKLSKDGKYPWHPLYVGYDVLPSIWPTSR